MLLEEFQPSFAVGNYHKNVTQSSRVRLVKIYFENVIKINHFGDEESSFSNCKNSIKQNTEQSWPSG